MNWGLIIKVILIGLIIYMICQIVEWEIVKKQMADKALDTFNTTELYYMAVGCNCTHWECDIELQDKVDELMEIKEDSK